MTSQKGPSHSRTSQEVFMTSQVGRFHLGTSCDVFATFHIRKSHLGNTWYVTMTSEIGWFYLGASETWWQRPKQVRLINVLVATLWWRLNVVRHVPT